MFLSLFFKFYKNRYLNHNMFWLVGDFYKVQFYRGFYDKHLLSFSTFEVKSIKYNTNEDKINFVLRTTQNIDILRPGLTGGFTLTGTADQPTTLEMEWYKPGPLQPDCVVLKDLYIKIESRVAQGSHFVDLHVSHHFIFFRSLHNWKSIMLTSFDSLCQGMY